MQATRRPCSVASPSRGSRCAHRDRCVRGLGTDDGGDEDSLEIEFRFGAKDLAGRRICGQKAAVDDAARLARSRRAPRPGAVVALASELDVDPAAHASDNATNDGGKDFLEYTGSRLPADRTTSRTGRRSDSRATLILLRSRPDLPVACGRVPGVPYPGPLQGAHSGSARDPVTGRVGAGTDPAKRPRLRFRAGGEIAVDQDGGARLDIEDPADPYAPPQGWREWPTGSGDSKGRMTGAGRDGASAHPWATGGLAPTIALFRTGPGSRRRKKWRPRRGLDTAYRPASRTTTSGKPLAVMLVALLAGLAGGLVGAGLVAATHPSQTPGAVQVTVVHGSPGPALADGSSIPAIVSKTLSSVVTITATGPSASVLGRRVLQPRSGHRDDHRRPGRHPHEQPRGGRVRRGVGDTSRPARVRTCLRGRNRPEPGHRLDPDIRSAAGPRACDLRRLGATSRWEMP